MNTFLSFLLATYLISGGSGPEFLFAPQASPQNFSIAAPPAELTGFEPIVTAASAIMVDAASGGVIWGKNQAEVRPMASLTKLMTALIILEEHELDEIVTVPAAAVTIDGVRVGLFANERITVGEMLKALLIRSGNDVALALALFHSGSEEAFARAMNARARLLGMHDTNFVNAHGLDAEGHVSTAFDLAILAKKVIAAPLLREIANTSHTTITSADGQITHELYTTNFLLGTTFPVVGLKTGTTENAGQCLITLFQKDGREILIVVLGSQDRFQDTKALFSPFL